MNLSPIRLKWFAAPVMAIGLGAVSAPAQAPELAMLNKIQPGLWNLKERGTAQNGDQLCVRDARKLLQLRHRELQCSRFVVSDEPDEVTVTYRCPGGGSGRTTIKYEGRGLVQIESQGIAQNSPFAFALEGRYAGSCTG
ncbi:hypothetical protein [Blastomonas sp. UPD001]|jgi:hypothetical protein|uniref:DUF3617 domain-containing protein n=1 Tax=unclassified Blastomonas TaxID=2626550 RepID=UPI00041AF6E2|nr:hypothetical protein [Blastomonas sp. UPD001]